MIYTICSMDIVDVNIGGNMIDKKQKCCDKPHKAEKFLKICLLTLLYDKADHGYSLIEELEKYGFEKEELSVSTLYRNLRKMEKEGLVKSSWKKGEGGPQKRVYTITEKGKDDLNEYINFIRYRKSVIERLINTYEEKIYKREAK